MIQPAEPVPSFKGRYNVYETPDGGFHISYTRDDKDGETFHVPLPGPLVRMTRMMQEGKLNPLQALKMMKGMQ